MEKIETTERGPPHEIQDRREQLEEAEETLRAIRCGEVDALVVSGPRGDQVYSLETAEHSYRVMVEAMSEGAVTLIGGGTIVYSNRSFATMVKMPLEEVIGSTMLRLVHPEDLPKFQSIVSEGCNDSNKGEIRLQTKDGSIVPVYFSVSAVETGNAPAVCAVVTDLTMQKRNQELLVSERLERVKRVEAEGARERIANILESITDCFFALDRQWRITDVNQRAAAIYKRNREELLGQVFWDVFPQKRMSDFQQHCHTVMLDRTPAHFEARSRVVEGCWLEFHLYPSDEGLAFYFRDITARKETEERLLRSETYLAEGQRLSHTASWAWKVSTGEVYWSAELFRIFGFDPEHVKPTYPEVLNYIHPDDRNRVQSAFQKAVREKEDYELAYRVVRDDGGITHVNNLAHPVFDKAGMLIEYVGTTVDTTERVRAEEQLRGSEARFRSYFELGLIGMAITSPAKQILDINDELCRIFGYPRAELLQKTWMEVTHPDDLPADIEQFDRVLAGQSDGYTMDKRWIRKDGGVINSIMAAKCLRRPDRSIDYFVKFIMDTTERRLAEEKLHKAKAELTRVARVTTLGELAASIAHEINQPLGAIVNNGNASLRLLRRESWWELRQAITAMVEDANRASTIIARIRGIINRSAPKKARLQLQDVVSDVLALAERELAEHRVMVRTEIDKNLTDISGDRVQLQELLLNLTKNAVEAMKEVPDERRVMTIRCQRSELNRKQAVLLTIQDRGCGFSSDEAGRIFDAFYTTKPKGMGMGLRICVSIAEAHGGRLAASLNSDGPGATFLLRLPAVGQHVERSNHGRS